MNGVSGFASRAAASTSRPSIFGILISQRIQSCAPSLIFRRPSTPSAASSMIKPSKERISFKALRIACSSSMTNMDWGMGKYWSVLVRNQSDRRDDKPPHYNAVKNSGHQACRKQGNSNNGIICRRIKRKQQQYHAHQEPRPDQCRRKMTHIVYRKLE